MTNLEPFYIVSAVRGAMGPGDVVFPRAAGASVVALGVAVVVAAGVVPAEAVGVGAAFALGDAADDSAAAGVGGDKLGGANMG